ncbi:cell division control protein 14, SIN component-domain-containing protein [Dioszegia hungarica]|uniref:Cell division control protein 14, SIN component-domain-containing protein n=1 Tax=Dioszegia hungarica TaxID=4972 RepID=A0AA38LTF5_9TREE|nr:cell division control protein 14, SIN component-domain-containing protein [Dioszegia hungarica]KAI9634770.1 cell division control protein 14, SIN component-domain-containing protein [Dioszegia hungarica]
MSRPQHRKSQSTSALSIIASSPARPSRMAREKARGGLERVEEAPTSSPRESVVARRGSHDRPETSASMSGGTPRGTSAASGRRKAVDVTDVKGWMNEILSMPTSGSRRTTILRHFEETLLRCCLGNEVDGIHLADLLGLYLHANLLILLTRHTQLLTARAQSHSSLHATDEVAIALVPELTSVFGLLQGLCLLSASCKAACAEAWTIEMLIDLLLLLRSIPVKDGNDPESRPVVYFILELLFCILVDSPEYSRVFERLSGLEAVTRVLKGSSVSKEVRMKCIEFLYFYLLPEHQSRSLSSSTRSVSTATSRSTSSSDSLYPPSPLDRSSYAKESPTIVHPSRSPNPTGDLDLHFVPQTPRKKVTPNLGYLTPSSRRGSGGASAKSTPALQTVPASPIDRGGSTPKANRRMSGDAEVGLGLGLPNTSAGAGGIKRDVTAIHLGSLVASPEPVSPRHRQADGRAPRSPTSSGKMSRSSTQPNISVLHSSQRQAHSRTSSQLSSHTDSPSSLPPAPHAPRIPEPKSPRLGHSRTSSHLSALAPDPPSGLSRSPSALLVPSASHSRVPSAEGVGMERTPSKARRAFPSELTRGLLPMPTSSPKPTPLGNSRRLPSRSERSASSIAPASSGQGQAGPDGAVRTVEEKKELLGQWLGNVDALVSGVEGVGWWGAQGRER